MRRLVFFINLLSSNLFFNLCLPTSVYLLGSYVEALHMVSDTLDLEEVGQRATEYVNDFNPRDSEDDSLIVETSNGKVRGVTLTANSGNKEVDAWFSIPYAQAPTGDLRFQPPKPIENWDDILNTTKPPNSCYQKTENFFANFTGETMWNANTPLSEDCLYLNIVVPKPRPTNATVMVWIHGGGFGVGTSTLEVYDHTIFVSEENIILASMQYRVGSLGFLYLGTSDVPGNVGLLDQTMALQWIHDNIAAFGGNPDNITLFGESAGAASVSLHLLSPLSKDLFSQAIMESGSAISPWAVISLERATKTGLQLAESVNCSNDQNDMQAVADCLRKTDPDAIVDNKWMETYGICEGAFRPIIDGAFLEEDPSQLLQNNTFKKTNILMGSNTEEGFYFLIFYIADILPREGNVSVSRQEYIQAVPKLNTHVNEIAQEAIIFEYTNWLDPDDGDSNRDALDKMVGDYNFACPVHQFADFFAETGNNVYMYHFGHKSEASPWPKWAGVIHTDEIPYVFGEPLNPTKNYTSEEVDLSKRMLRYWANFARTGNPNLSPSGNSTPTFWPAYTVNEREYLTLNTNSTATGRGPRLQQCAFWTQYIPQLTEMTDSLQNNQTANCTSLLQDEILLSQS